MATDFNAIMDSIIAAQDKANAANLQRYDQLLGSINALGTQVGEAGTYGKALALQEQVGTAGRQRITEQATKTWAAAEQDLTTRGLGNTTIREAVRRGTAHDAEMARQQLEESVAMQKSGIYQGLAGAQMRIGGMKAGAIEGRTDAGPNLGMFASLLSAAAAGEKADAAQVRTSRTLSAGTAARGPGTGWGGSAGGGGGGGIGQSGMGTGIGGGGTAARPGTVTRMGGGAPTGGTVTGGTGLNLAISPGAPTGGRPSTPALTGAAIGQEARTQEEAGGGEAVRPGVMEQGAALPATQVAGMTGTEMEQWTGVAGMGPSGAEEKDFSSTTPPYLLGAAAMAAIKRRGDWEAYQAYWAKRGGR